EEQVKKAQLTYDSAVRMAAKGMFRNLQLEGEKFAVDSAMKELELKRKQLETLDTYKKKKTLQELNSALAAAEARLAAEEAALKLEKDRLERDKEQLKNCIIRSAGEGMVIFPSAAEWKETPDIEEGAHVREQQTLLMIPDVTNMQVKVGIHESKVDQLQVGMPASVQMQEMTLDGKVDAIAEVTRPAGWWTGNMVKYDTTIKLEYRPGLKPGMSAVVDVILAQHQNVLKVPVAAIVESNGQHLCWVKSEDELKKRVVQLGDSNDEYTVVNGGLAEGDEVVLNPLAYVDEAQQAALQPTEAAPGESSSGEPSSGESSEAKVEPKAARDEPKKGKPVAGKQGAGKSK
ncbi:MAG: efflux RND transporter periplasmic adaptor subunit, partial [Pirellulales bacterium]|nr:efflux RND transporter periplasmic adaptor subunit [Pirellulales bacterium]